MVGVSTVKSLWDAPVEPLKLHLHNYRKLSVPQRWIMHQNKDEISL